VTLSCGAPPQGRALSLWVALRGHRDCPRCGPGYPISPACAAASLVPIAADACPRCAQRCCAGRCLSLGCRRGWFRAGATYAALGYNQGAAQRLVLAAKDAADPRAARLLGRLLAGFLRAHPALRRYDLLLPVPFHPEQLRGRPVHPLTAIYLDALPALRALVRCDDLAPPWLVQVHGVPSLRGQGEHARWRAVRGAFALGFRTRILRGARLLLLDDVMTTGATASECARVLIEDGGAARVDVLVLVRQPWHAHRGEGGRDLTASQAGV